MIPPAVPITCPLSPRFASLEKSLSENKGHSSDSPKYDGESRTSPRILSKTDAIPGKSELDIPVFSLRRLSPVTFIHDLAFESGNKDSGWNSHPLENMSLSLEKTLDSESLSITTKPLWEELEEAGYGADVHHGYPESFADLSSKATNERKSDTIEKGENETRKSAPTENKHKQLSGTSHSLFQQLMTKHAGGSTNNHVNNIQDESQTVISLPELDSSRSDRKNLLIFAQDKHPSNVTLTDTVVNDLKQTPTESNMERKLISNLPKKLREEAVLRTFAANLKLASSSSKTAASKRQSLEGRASADSGRESVIEDESRPRLYRFDSSSSVSSVGSTRSAVRAGNGGIKPWSVVMIAETIKKRRKDAESKGKKAKLELETLKEKLEQSQAKANGLEAELVPLREKLKRYEDIIENLEDKIEGNRQEIMVKDRDYLAKIDKLERTHSKTLQDERIAREEMESEMKNKIRTCESEVKFYKKQVDELEDNLALLKEGKDDDDENNPFAKQMDSLRKELVQVREVLASSEKERLNERKEKLSALQTMIKLTKLKSEIEEELDERKKADTKETSDKYLQLSENLAASEKKLQKLRKEMATEVERLQKKHVEETNALQKNHEKANTVLRKEASILKQQLKDLEEQNRPSSPGRALPYHGRWSAMRSESRKHTAEMKDIITELEAEGLGPEQCSSEEVVRVLFTKQKELSKKLKEADDILSTCKNGDPRPVIQELKSENKSLKRTVEDLEQSISTTESQLKLVEMTSKRQIEDLLTEKKSTFLQLQKAIDDYDLAKGNSEQLRKELVDAKSMVNKRQNELQLLRDNLMSVTNEMKTVDADLGKARKDLSLKSAENERLKRDIVLETERVQQERKNNARQSTELENKKRIIKDSDKVITELEAKVQRLTENLEASQMHVNRAVSERDSFKEEIQSLRLNHLSNESELNQSNSVLGNLKGQVKSLEYALQDKVDKLAAVSNELEKAKAESLGAYHLLGIEEERNKELEDEIDELTYKLTGKTEEIESLREKIKVLEEELDSTTKRFNSIQMEYVEKETSLISHESTKAVLGKELSTLQMEFRDISREKQKLSDILNVTKISLEEKIDRLEKLDKEINEYKKQLKERTSRIKEVSLKRDALQEELSYEKRQNQMLSKKVDASDSELKKNIQEMEILKSQLNEVSQGKELLSDQLDKIQKENKVESENQKKKFKLLQKENEDLQTEVKASNEKANQFENEAKRFKSELKGISNLMSNEKATLNNELIRMREEVNQELDSERRKHDEEIRQINGKHDLQKRNMEKLNQSLMEAETKSVQMEQFVNEKESQLRMLTREKEQLADSVKFLESELKNADSNLLEKEKELNAIKAEKEREISSLKAKQELIMEDLKDANDRLLERENEQLRSANEVDNVMSELKKENQELKSVKSQIEQTVENLEFELKKKEDEKENILQCHNDEMRLLEDSLSKLEEKIQRQESLLEQVQKELGEKTKENSQLNNKVRELIEESERVGEESCQVAQVQQVESAAFDYDFMGAEEKTRELEKEKHEIQQKLNEAAKELERTQKAAQVKRKYYQETEEEKKRLTKELQYERREKVEALKCLKALIVDNESMAKCVVGLQETVALQRQENNETKRHLKEVLDRYELQREISLRTQKTYENVLQAEFARSRQDSGSMQDNIKLKGDLEHVKKEKEKLAIQLENKDKELESTRSEIGSLRSLMETKVVNFEVEKRARELLESKLQQFVNDKSFAQKRLQSMENSHKDLHGKFIDLQKWHNNLEVNLINGISQSPLSLKGLYEDQERREIFLQQQSDALNEKYKMLGIKSGAELNNYTPEDER